MVLLEIISAIFGLLIFLGAIGAAIDPEKDSKRRQTYTYTTFGLGSTYIPPKKKEQSQTIAQNSSITPTSYASSDTKDAYWGLVSFAYQKLKRTPIYRQWRYEQFDCQFGKCGICGKPMDRSYMQLDHIKARYDYGTNYSDNLVLVHPKCNENKGANVGTRPSWVKENPYSKEFDEKAWEIIQDVQKEYPDKVPDSMLEPPNSNKVDYNITKEKEEDDGSFLDWL